jgi:hypothetical protein
LDANGNIIPSDKPKPKRGQGTNKTPIIGAIERDTGKVCVKGQKLSGKQPLDVREDGTTIATDDFDGYGILDRKGDNPFYHVTVNHSPGRFSAGDGSRANGIEGR